MKTSLLISSFAVLCLLVTFAEAPRRHGEDKMYLTSTDNISIKTLESAAMLTGVAITADADITIPAEDFSYLNFDVTEYTNEFALNLDEAEVLPEATDADYSYLKFDISDYSTDSEFSGDEITELPVNENNTISMPELALNEFEYLRFDVNDYINNCEMEAAGISELPIEEAKTGIKAEITLKGENPIEFAYLKFDVTKYYSSADLSSDEQLELPEE